MIDCCLEPLGFVRLSKTDNEGINHFYKELPVYKHPGRFVSHEGILYEHQHDFTNKGSIYITFIYITLPKPTEL